tara:strand:+ start:230 stop:475 length:246 start_codon:yes stop_codon:yes gene_type:complete
MDSFRKSDKDKAESFDPAFVEGSSAFLPSQLVFPPGVLRYYEGKLCANCQTGEACAKCMGVMTDAVDKLLGLRRYNSSTRN